jgi:hypothetical protein
MSRGSAWSEEEIKLLMDNFELSLEELSKLLPGRTRGAIKTYGYNLGLLRKDSKNLWTKKEIETLTKEYPLMGEVWCSKLLGRSLQAIKQKVIGLRLKRLKKTKNGFISYRTPMDWKQLSKLNQEIFLSTIKLIYFKQTNEKLTLKKLAIITQTSPKNVEQWFYKKTPRVLSYRLKRHIYLEIKYGIYDHV